MIRTNYLYVITGTQNDLLVKYRQPSVEGVTYICILLIEITFQKYHSEKNVP